MLELDEGKLSRPVLRRGARGNPVLLAGDILRQEYQGMTQGQVPRSTHVVLSVKPSCMKRLRQVRRAC